MSIINNYNSNYFLKDYIYIQYNYFLLKIFNY